ncbi:MAG: cold shock domain-containing protein [Gammaproteobacteria bacterium]|nr:cold shock domain-containing protein [Gammaproteobacteria bacterium]
MALLASFVINGGSSLVSPNTLILFAFILVSCILASLGSTTDAVALSADSPNEQSTKSTQSSGSRDTGQVKWFNSSKGFGFITRDDGQDVFVHFRSIRGEGRRFLRDGQSVAFDTGQGEKGLQAEDVEVLE